MVASIPRLHILRRFNVKTLAVDINSADVRHVQSVRVKRAKGGDNTPLLFEIRKSPGFFRVYLGLIVTTWSGT